MGTHGRQRYILGAFMACCAVTATVSQGTFHRELLQQTATQDDTAILDDSEALSGDTTQETPFQLVTQCLPYTPSITNALINVLSLNATIELDQTPDIYRIFNASDEYSWDAGNSRVNVSVALSQALSTGGGASALTAQVHTRPCSAIPGSDAPSIYIQRFAPGTHSNATLPLNVSGPNANASVIFNTLFNYDETKSLLVLNNGQRIGCCDLEPPLPTFPDDWTATIEANIVNKGYTIVQREYWSQTLNKLRVDLHSYSSDRVLLQDVATGTLTFISPDSATHPNGYCRTRGARGRSNFLARNSTANNSTAGNSTDVTATELISTAEFLNFANAEGATKARYVPNGRVDVRGIACEVWQSEFDIESSRFGNGSYVVQYYFPIDIWLVAREDYHRQIKRITLNGTRNNTDIYHSYEFVDFRPFVANPKLFNVCSIAPEGDNCNCTSQQIAENLLDSRATSAVAVDGFVAGDIAAAPQGARGSLVYGTAAQSGQTCSDPSGFTSSQGGPYSFFAIVFFFLGVLLTTLIAWLLMHRAGSSPSAFRKRPAPMSGQDGNARFMVEMHSPEAQ